MASGDRVPCFWIEPTGRVRLSLRRYVSAERERCALPLGFHDARAPLRDDTERIIIIAGARCLGSWYGCAPARDDPRWPQACACGFTFRPTDEWQVTQDQIYRRPDTGEEHPLQDWPPGAMFDTWWHHGIPDWCAPDGRALTVRLPDGTDWCIDGPAFGGDKRTAKLHAWTRFGTPPDVTASPSIQSSRYHGFLTAGVLIEC